MTENVSSRRRSRAAQKRRNRLAASFVTRLLAAVILLCAIITLAAGAGIGRKAQIDSKPQTLVHISPSAGPIKTIAPSCEPELPLEEVVPPPYTEADVNAIAKTVDGEAAITHSDMEMAAVVWCILNRVDCETEFPDTITEVLTPSQFHGYSEDNPVDEHIKWLVQDVLDRWIAEKNGAEDVGRVLPPEYLYFWGDGRHNHFTTEFRGGTTWDWSSPNPYES